MSYNANQEEMVTILYQMKRAEFSVMQKDLV